MTTRIVRLVSGLCASCLMMSVAVTISVDVPQLHAPASSFEFGQGRLSSRSHPTTGYKCVSLMPGDDMYDRYMRGNYAAITPESIVETITASQEGTVGSSRRRDTAGCAPSAQPGANRQDLEFQEVGDSVIYLQMYYTSHGLIVFSRKVWQGFASHPSIMFKSVDGGKSFEKVFGEDDKMYLFHIFKSDDNERFVIPYQQGGNNTNGALISKDGLKTIVPKVTEVSFFFVDFNSQDPERILASGAKNGRQKLFHSDNYGYDWKVVTESVLDFGWGDHKNPDFEKETTMYFTSNSVSADSNGKTAMYRTDDFMETPPTLLLHNTLFYETHGNYMFAFSGDTDSEITMKMTSNGGASFRPALFQSVGSISDRTWFTIVKLDEQDRILMVVEDIETGTSTKVSSKGTLYIGDGKTGQFTPALAGVPFNFKERNAKHEPIITTDIWQLESCDSVFIAQHYDGVDAKRWLTKISFDFGANWHPLEATEELFIPLDTVPNVPYFTDPKAKSVAFINAMPKSAEGTAGVALYMTFDAGRTWSKTLDGAHHVTSLDEGSVIVAHVLTGSTDTIWFSYEEGRPGTWTETQYAEAEENIVIFTQESGDRNKQIAILSADPTPGTPGAGNTLIFNSTVLSFDGILRDCKDTDYIKLVTEKCVLGQTMFRWHRDVTKCCFNSDTTLIDNLAVDSCKCTREDFECDWGYENDVELGTCVRMNNGTKDARDVACESGQESAVEPTGYKKIPFNMCVDGEGDNLLPSKIIACPSVTPSSNASAAIAAVAVSVSLVVLGIIGYAVYRVRNHRNLIPRLSIQADEGRLTLLNEEEEDKTLSDDADHMCNLYDDDR